MINRKTIILVLFVFLVGGMQAISNASNTSEKQEMIKRFFGEGEKLSAEEKKTWRKLAVMGDSSVQHDLGVYLAREGELEEAKKWWRMAVRNGDISCFRRLQQAAQIEKLEEQQKQQKKSKKTKKDEAK